MAETRRLVRQTVRRSVWLKLSKLSNRLQEGKQGLDSYSFVPHDSEHRFHSKCGGRHWMSWSKGKM